MDSSVLASSGCEIQCPCQKGTARTTATDNNKQQQTTTRSITNPLLDVLEPLFKCIVLSMSIINYYMFLINKSAWFKCFSPINHIKLTIPAKGGRFFAGFALVSNVNRFCSLVEVILIIIPFDLGLISLFMSLTLLCCFFPVVIESNQSSTTAKKKKNEEEERRRTKKTTTQ